MTCCFSEKILTLRHSRGPKNNNNIVKFIISKIEFIYAHIFVGIINFLCCYFK